MAASRYDFSIEQGSSFALSIVYKDGNGNIIDLTGYCARLMWKTNNGTIKVFSSLDTNYSEYWLNIDAVLGKIVFMLPSDITNSLGFKMAKYDLELQSGTDLYVGGGKQTDRILYGLISVVERFSQSPSQLDCAS
jgi:hypothetical protein